MKVTRREFVGAAAASVAAARLGWSAEAAARKAGKAVSLFNGKNLDGWYIFLRDLDRNPRPKNSDPEGIFKVKDGFIHVLGKEFGYIATEKEYDDFHLTVEFKWGDLKFAPRLDKRRDSGILYRFPADKEDKVWPFSLECQIQEGDCGDFWMIGGTSIIAGGAKQDRFFQKSTDTEKPYGEWNTVEVIADGGKVSHLVNGVLVNEGTEASVSKGRIVLQSEGAEIFFRKVEVRPGGAKL
jgi:hypothetical protein